MSNRKSVHIWTTNEIIQKVQDGVLGLQQNSLNSKGEYIGAAAECVSRAVEVEDV